MAKSFDDLAERTMSKAARQRAQERSLEILADLFLREVRAAVGLSQGELAARIGIKQPTLSKMESQEQDMQVETLRRIVHALGGELDIVARFPKGDVRLAEFSDRSRRHSKAGARAATRELELV